MDLSALTLKEDLHDLVSYIHYPKMSKAERETLNFKVMGSALKGFGAVSLFFSAVKLIHTAANLHRVSLFYGTVVCASLATIGHDALVVGHNMRKPDSLLKKVTTIVGGVIGPRISEQQRAEKFVALTEGTWVTKEFVRFMINRLTHLKV